MVYFLFSNSMISDNQLVTPTQTCCCLSLLAIVRGPISQTRGHNCHSGIGHLSLIAKLAACDIQACPYTSLSDLLHSYSQGIGIIETLSSVMGGWSGSRQHFRLILSTRIHKQPLHCSGKYSLRFCRLINCVLSYSHPTDRQTAAVPLCWSAIDYMLG